MANSIKIINPFSFSFDEFSQLVSNRNMDSKDLRCEPGMSSIDPVNHGFQREHSTIK